MACPCFFPERRLNSQPGAVRLPLGDGYGGRCHAGPGAPFAPDDRITGDFCNMGYARDGCPHFPGTMEPDAIRFVISRDITGTVTLLYALEKNHGPLGHGPLEYSRDAGWLMRHPDAIIQRQAEAYLESYLRRIA